MQVPSQSWGANQLARQRVGLSEHVLVTRATGLLKINATKNKSTKWSCWAVCVSACHTHQCLGLTLRLFCAQWLLLASSGELDGVPGMEPSLAAYKVKHLPSRTISLVLVNLLLNLDISLYDYVPFRGPTFCLFKNEATRAQWPATEWLLATISPRRISFLK